MGNVGFTGAGVLFIAFYAVWGFIPGTQPEEEAPAPGRHHLPAQPAGAKPAGAQPASAEAGALPARSFNTAATSRRGQGHPRAAQPVSDETAEMPAVGPETRAFPAAQDITDIPDTPAYGRHSRSED